MKVISVKYYWDLECSYFTGIFYSIDCFVFYKNGLVHKEDGPAKIYKSSNKYWYYKGDKYGTNSKFTNKIWKYKINKLKREEKLKLFK